MFDPIIEPMAIVSPVGSVRIPASGERKDTTIMPPVSKAEPKPFSTVEVEYIPQKKNRVPLLFVTVIVMIIYSIIYHSSN